jgi:two-component system, OmpR family, response regulator
MSGRSVRVLVVEDEDEESIRRLVVLGLRYEGFEVCRRLRADDDQVPVVFLTARTAIEDKLTGLTIGGDDYLTKPFSPHELHARIRLRVADVELDGDTHGAWRAGMPLRLTAKEFRLLRFLMANAGWVVSEAPILDDVWEYEFDGTGAIVETYIYYLRRKLDRLGGPLIRTVRGVGYSLRPPERRS